MKLTTKQKDLLEKHSKHHTDAHMNYMKRKMREGMTFSKAHKLAQTKVGK